MVNRIGQQLGNYRLKRLLGQGGFAQVYLGRHVHLGTPAAIKVLDNWTVSEEEFQALKREARVVSGLEHAHIVRVWDFSMIDDTPFIVMEYAPGGTLEKRHPRGTLLSPQEAVPYIAQVASALQFAHDHGVMHLDVKSANMLIARNQDILLSDFGIAQPAPNTRRPMTEHVMGTPPYMAPEHMDGRPLPASDQFSLGVVLYEWLSGSLPFRRSRLEPHARQVAPAPLAGRVQGITPQIEQVVMRALSPNPQQRFARVQDFADAYQEAVRQAHRSTRMFNVGPVPPFAANSGLPSPFRTTVRSQGMGQLGPTMPASPVGSTFYPPQSTGIPEHALVQQQRSLIQRARDMRREYERRSADIQRVLHMDEQAAQTEQQEALEVAGRDLDDAHQLVSRARDDLDDAGWGFWARLRLFAPHPTEPVYKQIPAAQMHECLKLARSMSERIDLFLRGFKSPGVIGKAFMPVAAIIAIVFGLLLSGVSAPSDRIMAVVVGAMVMFCGLLGVFALALLHTLRKAYVTLTYAGRLAASAHQQRVEEVKGRYRARYEEAHRRFEQRQLELERTRQTQLVELRESYRAFCEAAGDSGANWSDERWSKHDTWQSKPASPPVARIGSLTLDAFYELPPLPALFSSPRGDNLLIKTAQHTREAQDGRQRAVEALQSLLLRLLVTLSPDAVDYTIIDPSDLGSVLTPFLPLEGEHESLSANLVAIDGREIEQQLRQVLDRIRHFTYSSESSGSKQNESYHVLLVMGFPARFSQDALGDLLTIVKNGPRCGITTLIVADVDAPSPVGSDLGALERACRVIEWDGRQFTWRDADFSQGDFAFDTLPSPPLAASLLQSARRQLQESASLEHNARLHALLAQPQWPAAPDREGTTAWLGRSTARQAPASVTFRAESGSNLLMVGKQEEVALGLSLAASLSLAAQRAPRDLRYYVVDTGPKQEMAALLEPLLPQYMRRVVTRQHFHAGLAQVIAELHDLLRRPFSRGQEPDIYLLLHGLHRLDDLHSASGQPGSAAPLAPFAHLLSTIVRQGPEVGIHALVWCDRLQSLESALGEDIASYIDYRVSFEYALGRPDASAARAMAGRSSVAFTTYAELYDGATAQAGQPEKFRPYAMPSREWLQAAAGQIARKTS